MQPEARRKDLLLILSVLVVVAAISFLVGAKFASKHGSVQLGTPLFAGNQEIYEAPDDVDLEPLWKAWSILEDKYVPSGTSTELSNEEKLWGIIEGLAASHEDPYTVFLPPVESEIFADDISGNFEGVGMEIGMRDGFLTVIAPLKYTPAYRAGILAGDVIVRIDDVSTDRMGIDESVNLIRGEGGTPVVLTIAREGEDEFIDIEVIRDVIQIPTIDTELRPDGIFVIELYNFGAPSANLFREALREFVESGSTDLILDLRGNPGGFLESSVDIASWFLPAGEVVLSETFGEDEDEVVHRSKGYDIFTDELNMVILINQGSASASEILAGALSQHGVATVVGETSFGKGSVQELIDITDETSLKVTIARWFTPDGTSISDGGLEPDIVVERTLEDLQNDRDPQLERAVQLLK